MIHAEGARNRAPHRAELRSAEPYVAPLLDLLPRLAVVVLAGRVARAALLAPGITLIVVAPHASDGDGTAATAATAATGVRLTRVGVAPSVGGGASLGLAGTF